MRKDEKVLRCVDSQVPPGYAQGASCLYWVDSKPDSAAFEKFLAAYPGRVDLWIGTHTHTDPDDTYGRKSHIEKR
jgi:hypothetical protein